MHRRARHLTGRAAGASFHYDARRLSLSDGTAVQTFTDVAGTNDATQATSGNRPLFKTNIINGNPVVRFDGTDDFLSLTNTAAINTKYTAIALYKCTGTAGPTLTYKTGTGAPYTNFYNDAGGGNQQMYSYFTSTLFYATGFNMTSSFAMASTLADTGNYKLFYNGASKTTSTVSGASVTFVDSIGRRDSDSSKLNGDIASLIHITGAIVSDSLRRRFEQAIAFSFKVACS
jgi:hypothetical protein